MPATLFMANKYAAGIAGGDGEASAEAFRKAVLANANRGGENVSTGALMGALLGAACGFNNLPKDLVDGLAKSQRPQLDREVEAFLAASPLVAASSL